MKPVDILLATCNSEKYLAEQLNSLSGQTNENWRLIVHDDGSADGTLAILRTYAGRYPGKIRVIEDGLVFGSPRGNFSHLVSFTEGDYVMFCDHDDVWLPDKIEETLKKMLAAEERYGKDIPLLVHTDLKVADAGLKVIAGSFWKYQNLTPERAGGFSRIAMQNVVTGCTMMINKKLLALAAPVPENAIMHDWWFALCAAAFGKIECLATPTVLYRQHAVNNLGAQKWGFAYMANKAVSLWNTAEWDKQFSAQAEQLRQFLARYKDLLNNAQAESAQCFIGLRNTNRLKKIFIILKYGFFKNGFARNAGLFMKI